MPKQEHIEQDGQVVEVLSNGFYRVELGNGHKILAYRSGKIQRNKIKILQGDMVKVAITPYDLEKGRIIYRSK